MTVEYRQSTQTAQGRNPFTGAQDWGDGAYPGALILEASALWTHGAKPSVNNAGASTLALVLDATNTVTHQKTNLDSVSFNQKNNQIASTVATTVPTVLVRYPLSIMPVPRAPHVSSSMDHDKLLDDIFTQLQVEDFTNLPPPSLPPRLPFHCATLQATRLNTKHHHHERRYHPSAPRAPVLQRQKAVMCVDDLNLDLDFANTRVAQRRRAFRRASSGSSAERPHCALRRPRCEAECGSLGDAHTSWVRLARMTTTTTIQPTTTTAECSENNETTEL